MTVHITPAPAEPMDYKDLLDQDTRTVPDIVRKLGVQHIDVSEIPTEWYLSRAVHEREVERIWKRVWQVACRAEDIAEVGDTWVYDIAGISIIVLRSAPDEIKAYYNACLHRGRALRDCPGRVSQLQCPFHGFTWALDGTLRGIPSREEFPQINPEEFRLPEVKVGTWGGFVFINMDLDAEPLETFLGVLPEHFAKWPLEDRLKTTHVAKVFPCNWKLAHEAFLEAFHVNTTHPQFLMVAGEQFHQLDTFGNIGRILLGNMVPSRQLRWKPTPQEIFNAVTGIWEGEAPLVEFGDDVPLRPAVAAMSREQLRPLLGEAVETFSDAEMVDIFSYSVFPNLIPFGGFVGPLCYRFTPYGDNHEKCVMEVMVLSPVPPGDRPPPAKVQWIGDDENFMAAPGIGFMAPVLNQDTETLEHLMSGLRNNKRGKVVFAEHEELQIRHFYQLYKEAMDF